MELGFYFFVVLLWFFFFFFHFWQKTFCNEAACEKITYTHVLSKGRTEEKHYGKYRTQKGKTKKK